MTTTYCHFLKRVFNYHLWLVLLFPLFEFQMRGRWISRRRYNGLLCFSVFSTLLVLRTLFPDKMTENTDIVKIPRHFREVREAEGFEFESGDLVFELAKVLIQIIDMMNVVREALI